MSDKCIHKACVNYNEDFYDNCSDAVDGCIIKDLLIEKEKLTAERDALKGELAVKDRALELSVQDVVARKTCPNQVDKCPLEPSWSDCIKCHATYFINQVKETPCES